MKKYIPLFLCILLLASCTGASEKRSRVLKVYNWADYIDEEVLAEFPAWYKEQTGEDIRIIYQVFDINEIMLTKIERGQEDFDLVCPSEYIIERMLKKDLLLPINRNFGKTPDYIPNISPYIQKELEKISQPGRHTNDYVVPYMWGTAGILYNKKFKTLEEVSSWGCLWDAVNRGKILMKDSYRDAYGYVSAVATPEIMEAKIDTTIEQFSDLSYFFGPGADSVQINPIQYPDRKVVERCAMIRDFGDRTELVLEMWSRVKGDNLNTGIVLLIFAVFGILFVWIVWKRISIYKQKKRHHRRRRRIRR